MSGIRPGARDTKRARDLLYIDHGDTTFEVDIAAAKVHAFIGLVEVLGALVQVLDRRPPTTAAASTAETGA